MSGSVGPHCPVAELREGFPVTHSSWLLFKLWGELYTFLKAQLSSQKTDPEQTAILPSVRLSLLPEKIWARRRTATIKRKALMAPGIRGERANSSLLTGKLERVLQLRKGEESTEVCNVLWESTVLYASLNKMWAGKSDFTYVMFMEEEGREPCLPAWNARLHLCLRISCFSFKPISRPTTSIRSTATIAFLLT